MASSSLLASSILIPAIPTYHAPKSISKTAANFRTVNRPLNFSSPLRNSKRILTFSSSSLSYVGDDEEDEGLVQDLRVPLEWLETSIAAQESEWLRVTLHKWLDDEYCPEPTNVDISNTAAKSYYKSLVAKETDLGEILLNMARDLESISYQESFHGAYSSANAAISLIIQKLEQVQ